MSKIGAEILVNTQAVDDQTLAQLAKLNGGGFVTVWVDWASGINTAVADGSWSGIKAQVFSVTGAKVGTEILVNTATLLWQQDPHVAVLQNGNFVVTWTDGWDYFSWADHPGSQGVGGATSDNYGKAIKLQVFSANGTPIGTEVVATTEIRTDQTAEKITALGNGNFVVTWEDWSLSCVWAADGSLYSAGGYPGIKAQVFSATGAKVGAELAVTGSGFYTPQITTLANGGFVMAWHDGHYSVDDVRAQVFSDTGAKIGSEILVNTAGAGATFSMQTEERIIALSNGGFAVAWTDNNGDDSSQGVKAQVFNATGGKVGTEILVNTTTLNAQLHPQLAALKNGGFVVTWDNWGGSSSVGGITANAQVFDNSGARVGGEILVNTTAAGSGPQNGAQVAALDDGSFVVSWSDFYDIRYQVFDATGSKIGAEILANTTTEGGQYGVQVVALDGATFVVGWNDNLYGPSDGSGGAVKAQVFLADKTLRGGSSDDVLTGGEGDDQLTGLRGNDSLDGGAGIDQAFFSGNRADYTMSLTAAGWTVTDNVGTDGTDTLVNIEQLVFADMKLAVDTTRPSVTIFNPADEAKGVAVGRNIVLTFSETVQRGTGGILLKDATGATVATYDAATSTNLSITGNTLTINPASDLGIFTAYQVEIPAGAIKDLAGNSYAGVSDYNFSTQTLDSLYHFCVVAFSAAPGVEYMNQLAQAYNAGLSVKDVVNIFTTKSQFTSTYADSMTNSELATLLVANVVKTSASEATKTEAIRDIVGALDIGWTRGDMIYQVFGNLATKPLSDTTWGNTALQFKNQTEVARHFTEVMHNATTDMPTLKAVVGSITPATDVSTPELIATLIGVELGHMV